MRATRQPLAAGDDVAMVGRRIVGRALVLTDQGGAFHALELDDGTAIYWIRDPAGGPGAFARVDLGRKLGGALEALRKAARRRPGDVGRARRDQ